MGCGSSKVDPNEAKEYPPRERSTPCTTDLPWLLLFVAFCAFEVVYVADVGFKNGEPKRLYYGVDYLGNVCGLGKDKQSGKTERGVQLDLTEKPLWTMFSNMITYNSNTGLQTGAVPIGICIATGTCPLLAQEKSLVVPLLYEQGKTGFATIEEFNKLMSDGDINSTYALDWVRPILFDTKKESWGPYCGPDFATANASDPAVESYGNEQNSTTARAKRTMGDIQAAANTIVITCIAALVLGFVYVVLVSLFVKCIVYSAILLAFLCLAAIGYYFTDVGTSMQAAGNEGAENYTYAGYGFYGVAAIFACVIVAIRHTIRKAIGIVRLACAAIMDMKELVLWPIVPYSLILVCVGYCLVVWLYLISSGDLVVSKETGLRNFEYDKTTQQYMWINLFALLWTMVYWGDFGNTVIAWCTSDWYFTPSPLDANGKYVAPKSRKSTGEGAGLDGGDGESTWKGFALCRALKNTFLQSMGIIALGSLIVATVKFIRAIIMYLQKQANGNKVAEKLLACLQCIVLCVEKCLKYITKNAYILHTIQGGNFCQCGLAVFGVLTSQPVILALMEVVSLGVCLLGKIFVCAVSTGIGYFLLIEQKKKGEISGYWVPLAIILVLSWVIGAVFMAVYDMIMDTITVCHIQDNARCEPKGMYSSEDLKTEVTKAQEKAGVTKDEE